MSPRSHPRTARSCTEAALLRPCAKLARSTSLDQIMSLVRPHLIASLLALAACSPTVEGPIPLVIGTVNPRQRNEKPARVCHAQGDERGWRIELLGERFSPVAVDVLTGEPKPGIPTVRLKGAATVKLDRDDVCYRASGLMFLDIPTRDSAPALELPEGAYTLEVENLGGGRAELADALIIVPPPEVTRVTAPQGFI